MPTIGDALRAREAELFVGREEHLEAFARWLGSTQPILSVSGPGGMGKSMLLRRFRDIAEREGREVVLVDARTSEASPEGLTRAITGERKRDPVAHLNEAGAILMLDTFEDLAPLTGYLQQELLPPLDEGVGIVLSGRHPLASAWREWFPLMQRIELDGFSPEESHAYVERRGVEPGLAEEILALAGGLPLALSLASDMAVDLGIRRFSRAAEWRQTVQRLVEDVIQDVRDPLLRSLLEAAAVVRQFTEETLAAVIGEEHIRGGFEELCRLSAVKPAERGLVLHDDVRRIMIQDLQNRRPEDLMKLRQRARHHLRDLISRSRARDDAWLAEEHLYLLENSVLQEHYFHESPGVWVEAGRTEDVPALLAIHQAFYANVEAVPARPPAEEGSVDFAAAALRLPGIEIAVARASDGTLVGFGYLLPVCRATMSFVPADGPIRWLIETALGTEGLAALPEAPASADVFYMSTFVLTGNRLEEAIGALGRHGMKFLMRPALLLGATGEKMYAGAMEATGFTRIPEIGPSVAGDTPADGFIMDLRKVGPDAWVDAITSGRPVPKPLQPDAMEREVQQVLLHWQDDEHLACSALAPHALIRAADADSPPADAVRHMVLDAFKRARAGTRDELAFRAIELGYFQKVASHERVAERLNVSRTTFFRMLKRGVAAVARAID